MHVVADFAEQFQFETYVTAFDFHPHLLAVACQSTQGPFIRVSLRNDNSKIAVFNNVQQQQQSSTIIHLKGHVEKIDCIKIYQVSDNMNTTTTTSSSSIILCSASVDHVIVWYARVHSLDFTKCIVFDRLPQEPTHLAFDRTGTVIAIAMECQVILAKIHTSEILVTLEGHLGRITQCGFHPIHSHLFVTCGEDRMFRIWNLMERTIAFQSSVLSAFPILSMAMNPLTGDLAMGFSDGTLKIFILALVKENYFAKETVSLDLAKYLTKRQQKKQTKKELKALMDVSPNVVSALPSWARSNQANETAQLEAMIKAKISNGNTVDYSNVNPWLENSDGQGNGEGEGGRMISNETENSCAILSMEYFCTDHVAPLSGSTSTSTMGGGFNAHGEKQLIQSAQYLIIGVPNYLMQVNAFSHKIGVVHCFQSNDLEYDEDDEEERKDFDDAYAIRVAKAFQFSMDPQPNGEFILWCGIASAFTPLVTLLGLNIRQSSTNKEKPETHRIFQQKRSILPFDSSTKISPRQMQLDTKHFANISVLPSGPPPEGSVLTLPSLSYQKSSKDKQKKNKQLDKPITFHTRIKSSGYGAASNNCIKKKSIQERKTLPSKQQQTSSKDSSFMASYLKEYPVDCGVLQHFQEKHALPRQNFLHQGAIHHIEYSRDAKFLASAGQDKVAQVAKLPFSKFQGESNIFAGHDGPIRSIHWSHNNQMLLSTSSVDQTTRVWLADADTPSLIFGAAGNDPTAKGGNAHLSSAKRAMKRDIVDAQFFYMDKFILSAAGNSLRMHQFELDEVYARNLKKKITKNDVQVDENKSRKKKIAQWNCNDIQNITSLTCINSFLSHLVVLSGSDRSLRIFDVAQGKIVRTISDAHPKAPHTIALPNVSCYVSHPSNFYDLLLSSAVANGSMGGSIHLWDVRADNCMMRFGEHVNRVHPLGMSFSPCMRYIATGSEDRAAYIYDIRTGRSVTKLTGHTDVVTSVAFNPLYPQLATASYDGTIRFYSHKPN